MTDQSPRPLVRVRVWVEVDNDELVSSEQTFAGATAEQVQALIANAARAVSSTIPDMWETLE